MIGCIVGASRHWLFQGLLITAVALPGLAAELTVKRAGFEAGWKAAFAGQEAVARAAHAALGDYPVADFLVYAWLRHGLAVSDEAEVRAFFEKHDQWPIASDLRERWLETLADAEAWDKVDAYYIPDGADIDSRCIYLASQIAQGWSPRLGSVNEDLWLSGTSRSEYCDPVFDHWESTGQLADAIVARRAELAATNANWGLAEYLVDKINDPDVRRETRQVIDIQRYPLRELPRLASAGDVPDRLTGASIDAFQSLARGQNDAASALWPRIEPWLGDHPQGNTLQRELALFRATDYPPDARAGLDALPDAVIDQQIIEWQARLAILEGRWDVLVDDVERMNAEARNDAKWQYWLAYALEKTGESARAQELFENLARQASFYGFMAADRVGSDYSICPADSIPAPAERQKMAADPRMAEAIELFHADLITHARRHARLADRSHWEQAGRVAGWLAHDEGWHHQAVLELANAGAVTDYEARFPLVYDEAISAASGAFAVPQTFALAIMRSESALDRFARSSANAYGLMQLTLPTARKIAKANGWTRPSRDDLFIASRNIRFGTANVAALQAEYRHPLKVLAAYNAGPDPLDRWLNEGKIPVEADRWIESVPYYETREYIPRVLAFQVLYQWRSGADVIRVSEYLKALDETVDWPAADAAVAEVRCHKE